MLSLGGIWCPLVLMMIKVKAIIHLHFCCGPTHNPPSCPQCLWAANSCLVQAFTAPSVSASPEMCNPREHGFCFAPVLKHKMQKSLILHPPKPIKNNPNPQNLAQKWYYWSPDPSFVWSKPSSHVKGVQFNRLQDILQEVSTLPVCMYEIFKRSLDKGWRVHPRSLTSGHESMFFLSGQRNI